MTLMDLLGVPGKDVIFEGRSIFEFLTVLKTLPNRQRLDFDKLDNAIRITGTDRLSMQRDHRMPSGEVFGMAAGRTWAAEYRTAGMTTSPEICQTRPHGVMDTLVIAET